MDAPEIDYFTGRESIRASIEQILLQSTNLRRKTAVLHGLGGIGKTQLAIQYAKQHQQEYTAVLWFNAKDKDSLRQSFRKNASRLPNGAVSQTLLNDSQRISDLQELVEAVKNWLALPRNNQWLLIFDNVDNPKIPQNKDKSAYDIRLYFPEADQGSIIVTTRWASLKIGKSMGVEKLANDQESLRILVHTSGRGDIGEGELKGLVLRQY